jgi:hypothetical protein
MLSSRKEGWRLRATFFSKQPCTICSTANGDLPRIIGAIQGRGLSQSRSLSIDAEAGALSSFSKKLDG